VSFALCKLDIDLALWMFDKMLVVDCFHLSAPSLVFCLMTFSSSVRRWSLLEFSSFLCSSCSSDVGPQQQQYHVRPNHDLMLGQKHWIANTMTITKAAMQAIRIKNGIERNGWNAS
jgi:hypothetical protein